MARRRPLLVILALTLALTLPSIAIGFFSDDYLLRDEATGSFPDAPPAWDLYRFTGATDAENVARVSRGELTWWASPDFRLHLVRPLSSALFTLDQRTFGASPLGYHLVSIAWYLALVAAVGALLRRLLPGGAATLATFVFAIDPAHVFPWGWASCRHMTIAATFSVLALLALVRARQDAWRKGPWLAALALAAGLAAGETAVGGAAFAVAYAALGARAGESWRARATLAAPAMGTTAVYLVAYAVAGGGAAHGGGYLSPMSNPVAFARAAAERLPVMLANATLGVPAEVSSVTPLAPWVVAAAIGCAVVFVLARATLPSAGPEARAALVWLVPGALLALVAALGGFPGARLLLLPDVGFASLFGVVLARGFARAGSTGASLWVRRALAVVLAAIHVALAPLAALANTLTNVRIGRELEAVAADLGREATPGDRIFLLAGSDPIVSMYPPSVLLAGSRAWATSCWSAASTARATHRVTRTGPSSLAIEPLGTTMLTGAFETLYRAPDEPMHEGDVVAQCGATYRVAAVRDGRPTRVELTLDVPLEDPRVCVVAWQDGKLAKVALPRVGEAIEIAWSPGPIGFF